MRLWMVLLFAVSLLHSSEAQKSSVVTHVFVQKGDDVLLNVTTPDGLEEDFDGSWKFNKKANIVRFYPIRDPVRSTVYSERIEFSVKNYSLKLKNLQEADSGLYTAQAQGTELLKILAEYNITVQDPVSPVKVTVHPSVSISSETCNLAVTCRTQDSHINSTFRCLNQTCSQEGGEQSQVTTSGASLQVYLSNGSIICNHSNQVSWTKDIGKIEPFCTRNTGAVAPNNTTVIVVVVISVSILIVMIVAAVYLLKKRKCNEREAENTIYEVPQVGTTAQTLNQTPTNDASGLSPTSTYCLVGPHNRPTGSTENRGTTLMPESVYAQVEKTARSLNY